jgi:hypothetical protein
VVRNLAVLMLQARDMLKRKAHPGGNCDDGNANQAGHENESRKLPSDTNSHHLTVDGPQARRRVLIMRPVSGGRRERRSGRRVGVGRRVFQRIGIV